MRGLWRVDYIVRKPDKWSINLLNNQECYIDSEIKINFKT